MNAEELAAIRERHRNDDTRRHHCLDCSSGEVPALLAHIDALTAKVEGLDKPADDTPRWDTVDRAAVLAILRGEA